MVSQPVRKKIIGIDPGYAITGYGIIEKIGNSFEESQNKLKLIRQIAALESKKNDIVFKELVKEYE